MIIGVDADGVLTDMQEFNYQCGKKFFRKEIVNPTGYSVKEIFKVSKTAEFCCGLKYFPKYCKEYPPRPDTAEILGKLKAEGHVLHEITARKFVTSKFPWGKLSRKWFLLRIFSCRCICRRCCSSIFLQNYIPLFRLDSHFHRIYL